MQIKVLKDISVPIATAVLLEGRVKRKLQTSSERFVNFYAEDVTDSYVTDAMV
jgi:hypothetical protein